MITKTPSEFHDPDSLVSTGNSGKFAEARSYLSEFDYHVKQFMPQTGSLYEPQAESLEVVAGQSYRRQSNTYQMILVMAI